MINECGGASPLRTQIVDTVDQQSSEASNLRRVNFEDYEEYTLL